MKHLIPFLLAGLWALQSINAQAETEQQRQVRIRGEFGGIGVGLKPDGDAFAFDKIIPGGPAEASGIETGQKLLSVQGQPIKGMSLNQVVELIRGPIGTKVDLEIEPTPGVPSKRLSITRARVLVASVQVTLQDSSWGVVAIPSFNNQTAEELSSKLRDLKQKGAKGIVVDLRDSGGGVPQAMSDVASLFLTNNAPCWLFRKRGETTAETIRGSKRLIWEGPLTVLVNTNTHGSALVASALQKNNRAKVLGQQTNKDLFFGKTTVLPNGTKQADIHGYFYSIDDKPIYEKGVTPDIVVNLATSPASVLQKAIEILKNPQ